MDALCSKPAPLGGGLVNRPLRACCEHPRLRRRSSPDRDASRGTRRATSCVGPFHGVPRRSSPSAEARWEPFGAYRPPGSLFVAEAHPTERALSWSAPSAVCPHNPNALTNHTDTHSAGQRHPPAGACRNRGSRGLAPATARRWQATARDLNRAASSIDRSRTWLPVAALAESSSFPRERGETSRNDARDARAALLAERSPAAACCKDNGHSLSLPGCRPPAETGARHRPRPPRIEPLRPCTVGCRDDDSSQRRRVLPRKPTARASPSGF